MVEALRRQPALLYLLLAGYFVLQVVARLSLPRSLELDEGQQLFLAQWFAVGYDTQPPFYNWLQYAVVSLTGASVASLSVLKNGLLFFSYLLYGLTANRLLKNRDLAIIATLGLLTIPQVSFEAQRDLTHTVAVIFAACLFLYGFTRTLKTPSLVGYALTGAAIGIGLISKYNFALLPAAALLATLMEQEFRHRLFDWRMLATIAITLLIVTPHGLWFLQHMDVATGRTLGKLHIEENAGLLATRAEGLLSLALALVGFCALTLALFAVIFGRGLREALRAENIWTRLIGRMMVIILIALACMILFTGATHIKDRWLAPFFLVLPLYLCLKIEASGRPTLEGALRRTLGISAVIAVLVIGVLTLRVPFDSWTDDDYEKVNVPYGPAVTKILSEGPHQPTIIAANDMQMAGNIRLHESGIPVTVPGYQSFEPSYPWDRERPILLIWKRDGEETPLPQNLAAWLAAKSPAAKTVTGHVTLPYHYGDGDDFFTFGYVWAYPPEQ